jgi:hypothetical protein
MEHLQFVIKHADYFRFITTVWLTVVSGVVYAFNVLVAF